MAKKRGRDSDLGDMFEPLPNLLRWPGGKARLREKLLKHFPEHRVYTEPFAGGASFFFGKQTAPVEVINDASKNLTDFYKGVGKGALRKCKYTHSRALFERLMSKHKRGEKLTPCEYFTLNKISFGGSMRRFGEDDSARGKTNPKAQRVFERLDEYERKLRHAKIMNTDFEKVVREFDGANTFHYMDPPYEGAAKARDLAEWYAGNASVERVAKVARGAKGKVMVSYGDTEDVRAAFCGKPARGGDKKFRCYTVATKYQFGANHGTANTKRQELVIVNYLLKKGGF